ncbi:uncharacterized protein LOC144660710 [Oculina patagonica]
MATRVLLKRSLWRTFLFAAYSMFGSWLFYYIERTPITYKEMSANMLDELKQKYNMSMNHSDFTAFANDAYKAIKVGRKVEWTFLNTTSYVFTILTTIGYGHMTPDTWVGQLVTVFYGLVGLPISMLALKTLGEVIVSGIQSLVLRIEKRSLKTKQVRKIRQKTFVGTCVLMILFLLLGSVINVLAEGWSFVEGIYVWFVVLSTIGFGDYIPFQSLDQKSESGREILWVLIAILAFFVLLGLCVVSAVLTSLVQAAEEFKSKTKPTGYGNITPRTAAGQIVTIVYALFGIPLTLLTLKSIGGWYNKLVKCIITMIENCFRGMQHEIKNLELKVLIANVFLLVALILSAAVVSSYENTWSIRQGIYVWFITLTTVGFGEFVPEIMMKGLQPNTLIIPGLCFMSGVVDALVEYVNKADVRILRCRGAACLCCNNSTHLSDGDNVIEIADTQDHSCNNSGFEATTTKQDTINSCNDTTL